MTRLTRQRLEQKIKEQRQTFDSEEQQLRQVMFNSNAKYCFSGEPLVEDEDLQAYEDHLKLSNQHMRYLTAVHRDHFKKTNDSAVRYELQRYAQPEQKPSFRMKFEYHRRGANIVPRMILQPVPEERKEALPTDVEEATYALWNALMTVEIVTPHAIWSVSDLSRLPIARANKLRGQTP